MFLLHFEVIRDPIYRHNEISITVTVTRRAIWNLLVLYNNETINMLMTSSMHRGYLHLTSCRSIILSKNLSLNDISGADLSQCLYLERLETPSTMTMQSVTSPNVLKYSCKPSVIQRTRYKWVWSNMNQKHVAQLTFPSLKNQSNFNRKHASLYTIECTVRSSVLPLVVSVDNPPTKIFLKRTSRAKD